MDPIVEKMVSKANIIGNILVDYSRTEWDGMDGERLLMLLDQEQHPTANDDLYTLEEVAKILSMSVVTIRQYVRMNKLKAIKVWRNWMVNSNEVARLFYEKNTGKNINSKTTMFTIIDASVSEYDMSILSINKHKFLSPDDIADICGNEYHSIKVDTYERLFENNPTDTIYIEIVSNIPNFFRKTGDIPIPDNEKKQVDLSNYQVKQDITEKILQESYYLIQSETPKEDIEELFGKFEEKETIFKIYRTMLAFSKKYKKQQHHIQSLESDFKILNSQLENLQKENIK